MRIKNHPAAAVEVYVDGRVELFHDPHTNVLEAIKIGLITVCFQNAKVQLSELPPGRYNLTLRRYSWFKQNTDFDLTQV